MDSWAKLGRAVGLLVLLATLTAGSASSWPTRPLPAAVHPAAPALVGPERTQGQIGMDGSADPVPPGIGPLEAGSPGWSGSGLSATPGADADASPVPEATLEPGYPGGESGDCPSVIVHVVAKGETVSGIAAAYGVTTSTVAASEGLPNPNRISPGQLLVFPSVDGLLHTVQAGDTLSEIGRVFSVDSEVIARANGVTDPTMLKVGQVLIVPGGRLLTASAAASRATATTEAVNVALAWPLRGPITSPFGQRWGRLHAGIDIAAPHGSTIRAAAAGRVTFVGWSGPYGQTIIIDHGGGLTTLYAHASSVLVTAGARVARGEAIARVGSTGNSTGPHCHFEVRVNGIARNPLNYLGN